MISPHARLALFGSLLALAMGASACGLAGTVAENGVESLAIDGLGLELFLGFLAFAGAALARGDPRDRLGLRRGRLSAGQNAALIVGTLGASVALDGLLDLTHLGEHSALFEFEQIVAGVRGRALLLSLAAFVIAPGVCEELLCRGLVQRGLVKRFGPVPGIVVAAAVFGSLHLDPIHAAFAAILGLYLGAVCHLADSLRSPIGCHLVNNLVALLSIAYWPGAAGDDGLTRLALGASIAAAALWGVWRRVGRRSAPETNSLGWGQ